MSRPPAPCALRVVDADGLFNTRWDEYPLLVDVRDASSGSGSGGGAAVGHALPLALEAGVPRTTVTQRLREAVEAATRSWAPNDRCASVTLLVPVTADEARRAIEAAASAATATQTTATEPSSGPPPLLGTILAVLCDPTTSGLPFRVARVVPAEAVAGFVTAYPFLVRLPKPVRLPCLPHRVPLPGAPPGGASAGLFLSHSDAARDGATFSQLRVSRVLNCSMELRNFYEAPASRSVDFPRDLEYLRLPLKDANGQRLDDALAAAVPFIGAALRDGRRVLVHCAQGLSRSVSVVLAYLILAHGLSLEEATARLDDYVVHGSLPRPNAGFMAQLQALSERRCDGTPAGGSAPGSGAGAPSAVAHAPEP